MNRHDVITAWGRVLRGYKPLLSIEITRECPLRCPGCYAYEDAHLNTGTNLRTLSDFKGDELVRRVLAVVDAERPLHLSIVGGDPLVRYREVTALLPQLSARGIYTQVVTSAFRQIPPEWKTIPNVEVVVSIDGLQPEHDARRKPATYDRILQSIAGHQITVHCTITAQMLRRPGYLEEFLRFWTPLPEVRRVWMSIFTPQRGAGSEEILSPEQRRDVVAELTRLVPLYPKLEMNPETLREFLSPPRSPQECIFAKVTETISADLKTRITPCQFGGDPDCSQCGCVASMALAGVGHKRATAMISVGAVLAASARIGNSVRDRRKRRAAAA